MLFPECSMHAHTCWLLLMHAPGPGIPLLLKLANSYSSFQAQVKIVLSVRAFKPCAQCQLMCKCSVAFMMMLQFPTCKTICIFIMYTDIINCATSPSPCTVPFSVLWHQGHFPLESACDSGVLREHTLSLRKWGAGVRCLVICFGFKTEKSDGNLGFLSRLYSPGYQTWKEAAVECRNSF